MYQAVILAGGFGTRMRPLTDTVPKPMLPVGGEPNLVRLCEHLCKNGIYSAVVTLKYLPRMITNTLKDNCRGVDLYYTYEDEPLGTAGAVKAAGALLENDFLVISADAVCTLDLSAAFELHKKSGAVVTMLTHKVSDPLSYGGVVTDKTGRITSFAEKPSWQSVVSDKVNTGIYIMSRRALDFIPDGKACDLSADIFPVMLAENELLTGYEAEGYWRDIGSFDEYLAANRELFGNGGGATEGSVWGDGFSLGENSAMIGSVAFDNVKIGRNCSVNGSILAKDVTVDDGCVIRQGCVVAEGAHICDGVKLGAGVTVGPGQTLSEDKGDIMPAKSKLFDNGVVYIDDTKQLMQLAYAVASVASGPVGVCCEEGGECENKARIFACALYDNGADVCDLGVCCKYAYKLAPELYGCTVTAYISGCGDGRVAVNTVDISGMPLNKSAETKIMNAFRSEPVCGGHGSIRRVDGLDLIYYHRLATSADLCGVRVSLAASKDTAGLPAALRSAGASVSAANDAYTDDGAFCINTNDGAMLLSSKDAYCSFDVSLLILLSLIDPEKEKTISLPCFLPDIYEKTAKKRGISVVRYLQKPSFEQSADNEARMLRMSCMYTFDPLFCAVRLMSELKKHGMNLSEAKEKYAGCVIKRADIEVSEKEKAGCMRQLYEAYMPYQVAYTDGVSIVEGGCEGVAMADDGDRIRLVISADSEEAAEDAVAEVMLRMGKLRS